MWSEKFFVLGASQHNNTSLGDVQDDFLSLSCHTGICSKMISYQPTGLTTPLSLFLVSSLPVAFLLFFVWKANSNYKQGKNLPSYLPQHLLIVLH
jgi:hypothetical protein